MILLLLLFVDYLRIPKEVLKWMGAVVATASPPQDSGRRTVAAELLRLEALNEKGA